MIQLPVDENEPVDFEPTPNEDDIADIEAWLAATPDVPPITHAPEMKAMGRFSLRDWEKWDEEHEGSGGKTLGYKLSQSSGTDKWNGTLCTKCTAKAEAAGDQFDTKSPITKDKSEQSVDVCEDCGKTIQMGKLVQERDWALWDETHEGTGRVIEAAKEEAWHKEPTEAQQTAIHDYTGFGYSIVNGPLREPGYSIDPGIAAQGRQNGDLIHEAMRPMPDAATLYRSLDPALFGFVHPTRLDPATGKAGSLDGLERIVGATFTDPGFASTSHKEDVACAEPGGILTVIHVPEGTRALGVADQFASNPDLKEHEVILDKGTTFRVTGIDPKGSKSPSGYINTHPIVHMEVVRQA